MNNYQKIIDAVKTNPEITYYENNGDLILNAKDMVMIFSTVGNRGTIVDACMSHSVYEKMIADMQVKRNELLAIGAQDIKSPTAVFAYTYGYGIGGITFVLNSFNFDEVYAHIMKYQSRHLNNVGNPSREVVYLVQRNEDYVTCGVFNSFDAALDGVWRRVACGAIYEEFEDYRIIPFDMNVMYGI